MNPYVEIIKEMQKQGEKLNPPTIEIGTMINSNTLKLGDLQVTRSNLLIADYLVKDYKRQVSVDGNAPNEHKFTDGLKQGDMVAVLPTADGQKYIILCKVVLP